MTTRIENPDDPCVYVCDQCIKTWVVGDEAMHLNVPDFAFRAWPMLHTARHPGHRVSMSRGRPSDREVHAGLCGGDIREAEAFALGLFAGREGAVFYMKIGLLRHVIHTELAFGMPSADDTRRLILDTERDRFLPWLTQEQGTNNTTDPLLRIAPNRYVAWDDVRAMTVELRTEAESEDSPYPEDQFCVVFGLRGEDRVNGPTHPDRDAAEKELETFLELWRQRLTRTA
jgi:hypothetical protein